MGTTKGSKDPNSRVLGLKYHCYYCIWALNPIIWVLGSVGIYHLKDVLRAT